MVFGRTAATGKKDKMIKSMTGFGRATAETEKYGLAAEVKSVNHRYLDVSVKSPRIYGFLEEPVKAKVCQAVSRGKVDVFISVDSSRAGEIRINLNRPVLEGYLAALKMISQEYGLAGELTAVEAARFPDALGTERQEADAEQMTAEVLSVLERALSDFCAMREKEGKRMRDDLLDRLSAIERITEQVELRSPETVNEYREKLLARMQEVLHDVTIDPQRILTEAAIFADKTAINEEVVRLKSHLAAMRKMLDEKAPVGRKLDFLVQEMNREANTIGSKGNDFAVASLVVELKAEIEKIKEQVQNIE